MAFNATSAELLLLCRRRFPQALDFLMLGRQWLRIQPDEARRLQQTYEVQMDDLSDATMTDTMYAETLLQRMKLRSIVALDATAYQGAGLIHDLNTPLPAHHTGKHDYVVDGGSLEHVFDFPTAIRNCVALLKPGGLFITICPVNNWMGHGFYQFSPELYYRALSPENGFEISRMILHMVGPYAKWYEVSDPNAVRARVELVSFAPMQLLVLAKRIALKPIFASPPQQSDYTPRWQPAKPGDPPPVNYEPPRPWISTVLPGAARLLNVIKNGVGLLRTHTLWNRRSYRPVPKP